MNQKKTNKITQVLEVNIDEFSCSLGKGTMTNIPDAMKKKNIILY